ncbi:MAG: HAD family hydrolase [Lachnospiraceae bacterium]|nr:HAD family hydrolase [Lachnospiraceae bacterium]
MKSESLKKKILSFDLDMTLIDDRTNTIPQSALDAIDRVRDWYYIVISTGRDLTLEANQFALEQVRPDACVHSNGTQIHIGKERIYLRLFEKPLVKRLLDFAMEHQLCVCSVIDNVQYTTSRKQMEPLQHILAGAAAPAWGTAKELLEKPVQTLGLAGTDEDAAMLRAAFPEVKVTPVIPDMWCDIMEPEVSKAFGMKKLLEHYNLSMQDVIAFGDSMNDYELLAAAGFSVAMGNADPKLKQIADMVTDDIDKDGIAKALAILTA